MPRSEEAINPILCAIVYEYWLKFNSNLLKNVEYLSDSSRSYAGLLISFESVSAQLLKLRTDFDSQSCCSEGAPNFLRDVLKYGVIANQLDLSRGLGERVQLALFFYNQSAVGGKNKLSLADGGFYDGDSEEIGQYDVSSDELIQLATDWCLDDESALKRALMAVRHLFLSEKTKTADDMRGGILKRLQSLKLHTQASDLKIRLTSGRHHVRQLKDAIQSYCPQYYCLTDLFSRESHSVHVTFKTNKKYMISLPAQFSGLCRVLQHESPCLDELEVQLNELYAKGESLQTANAIKLWSSCMAVRAMLKVRGLSADDLKSLAQSLEPLLDETMVERKAFIGEESICRLFRELYFRSINKNCRPKTACQPYVSASRTFESLLVKQRVATPAS